MHSAEVTTIVARAQVRPAPRRRTGPASLHVRCIGQARRPPTFRVTAGGTPHARFYLSVYDPKSLASEPVLCTVWGHRIGLLAPEAVVRPREWVYIGGQARVDRWTNPRGEARVRL